MLPPAVPSIWEVLSKHNISKLPAEISRIRYFLTDQTAQACRRNLQLVDKTLAPTTSREFNTNAAVNLEICKYKAEQMKRSCDLEEQKKATIIETYEALESTVEEWGKRAACESQAKCKAKELL